MSETMVLGGVAAVFVVFLLLFLGVRHALLRGHPGNRGGRPADPSGAGNSGLDSDHDWHMRQQSHAHGHDHHDHGSGGMDFGGGGGDGSGGGGGDCGGGGGGD